MAIQATQMFHQRTHGIAVVASIERKNKPVRIRLDGVLIAAGQDRAGHASTEQTQAGLPTPM